MSTSSGTRETKLAQFLYQHAVSSLGVDSTNLRAFSQVSISDAADRQYNKECMQASMQDQTAPRFRFGKGKYTKNLATYAEATRETT